MIKTPGKLIISGEHAVLHGAPILGTALPIYSHANLIRLSRPDAVVFMEDLPASFTLKNTDMLPELCELPALAMKLFTEKLGIPQRRFELVIGSDLPMGAGLGSSASILTAMIRELIQFFEIDCSDEKAFELIKEAEHFQHGKSSGFDPWVCFHGGAWLMQNGQFTAQPDLTLPTGWQVIFTGTPENSTRDCVARTTKIITESRSCRSRRSSNTSRYLNDFEQLTLAIAQKLSAGEADSELNGLIHQNQELLAEIGVSRPKTNEFFKALKRLGGAGKVCGAGAISGENNGVLLVNPGPDPTAFSALLADFGYQSLCTF